MDKLLSLSILYVEDDKLTRSVFIKILKKLVDTLHVAEDGQEGLELFNALEIDLIITDITMPRMDGLEMTAAIRKIDKNIPIIITTAYNDPTHLLKAINYGADRFLNKPVKTKELAEILKIYEERSRTAKRLEAKTRQLEQLNEVVEHNLMVSRTDPEGTIIYVNDKYCEVSGYQREELLGQTHTIIAHPDTDASTYTDLWYNILSKKIFHHVVKNRRKDGSDFIADNTIIPVLDEEGEITEFIGIGSDLTQPLQQKEQDHKSEINQVKESFLIVFTHELKTPLNAIINFTQYVIRQLGKENFKKRDKLSELLEDVKRNAYDMLDHIQSILEISKIKNNKFTFKKVHFDLVEILADSLAQHRSLVDAEGIRVELALPESLMIYSDKAAIKRIFSNFYSNAIKYGNDTIAITLRSDGENFTLSVEDNGEGIREKEKIFDLFEQEQSDDMTRTAKGTGVGLHFVKLLCEALHFKLSLTDSVHHGGANFTIQGSVDA